MFWWLSVGGKLTFENESQVTNDAESVGGGGEGGGGVRSKEGERERERERFQ